MRGRDDGRLPVGVLERDLPWRARLQLLDLGDHHRERDPELLEDRPPLRGARREQQLRAACLQARSGKNSATSRAADSGASDPCTMFWPTAIA